MFNNIKWCLCEWEERVVARNVPLVQYISFIGVKVRSACIYLFSTTAYVNGPFLHLDTSLCAMTHHARARHILPALFAGVHIRKNHFS